MLYTQEQVEIIVAYEVGKALAIALASARVVPYKSHNVDIQKSVSNGSEILEFMRKQDLNEFGTVILKRTDLMRKMNKNRAFFEGINKNLPEGLTHKSLVYTYTK